MGRWSWSSTWGSIYTTASLTTLSTDADASVCKAAAHTCAMVIWLHGFWLSPDSFVACVC